MNDHIKLPQNLEGLKPVLILPLLSTLVVGLIMIFVVGPPVAAVLDALTGWLNGHAGEQRRAAGRCCSGR